MDRGLQEHLEIQKLQKNNNKADAKTQDIGEEGIKQDSIPHSTSAVKPNRKINQVEFSNIYEAEQYLHLVFPSQSAARNPSERRTCWLSSTLESYRCAVKQMLRVSHMERNMKVVDSSIENHSGSLGLSLWEWPETRNRI